MKTERDNLRKGHVQLRTEMLTAKGKYDAAASALEVGCLEAEAEVVELKEKIATMERIAYHAPPPTTSATAGSVLQATMAGRGSGLVAQVSPQPGRTTQGRGMSGLAARQLLTPPGRGRGLLGSHALYRAGSLSATSSASLGTGPGLGMFAPGQHLGTPAANVGQAQGPGDVMDVDEAEHTLETSTVGNGGSSTTTDQGPAQPGPHNSPQ